MWTGEDIQSPPTIYWRLCGSAFRNTALMRQTLAILGSDVSGNTDLNFFLIDLSVLLMKPSTVARESGT